MSDKNPTFAVIDVLTTACAVHRINKGFVKSADARPEDGIIANSTFLYSHFLGVHDKASNSNKKQEVTSTPEDVAGAETIIDYLKGLTFKAMERELTDFEKNVLKLVSSDVVGKDKIGIAASLPKVFQNKVESDVWAVRETELSTVSDYIGKVGKRDNFNIIIENVRYISSVGSKLFCASVDGKNIVKFFNNDITAKVGETLAIGAYVKDHSVSKYHHGKETIVNRIKVLTTD